MPTDRPAVHVFEPSHLGHRPFFVAWLLNDPPSTHRWVLHTTGPVLDHPALATLRRSPPDNVEVVLLRHCRVDPGRATGWRRMVGQFTTVAAFRRSWRRHARTGDIAFIPFYDDLALALALPWLTADMPLTTIGMRAQFHQRGQGIVPAEPDRWRGIKEFLLRRLLTRRSSGCHLTNQLPLKREVDVRWGRLARKVRFYPDPADRPDPVGKAEARRRLGLPPDRRYVLSYGSLTARKGVDHLLAAMALPEWPDDVAAIVAGACRGPVEDLLASPRAEALAGRGRLHYFPGFADSVRENLLFQAADAVWVVYDGHDFMSGCLVQAGMHRRPAIGCPTGLIAWYIRSASGGLLFDPHPARNTASLRDLAALLGDEERMAAGGERLGRAFAGHTREDFRASVHAGILGLADPCPLTASRFGRAPDFSRCPPAPAS